MTAKHHGRTTPEKAHRVLRDPAELLAQKAREAAEEKEWAERSGPVTVRYKDKDKDKDES